MKAPTFRGRVEGGKVVTASDTKQAMAVWIKSLEGEDVDLIVRKHRSVRSLAQNARYWALLTTAAESLWGDRSLAEDLHEEVAHLLLALPACPKTGLRRRERTPTLNTQEFTVYMDRVVDKLIELGADLSDWTSETERAVA